jgi:hypothetical protein
MACKKLYAEILPKLSAGFGKDVSGDRLRNLRAILSIWCNADIIATNAQARPSVSNRSDAKTKLDSSNGRSTTVEPPVRLTFK